MKTSNKIVVQRTYVAHTENKNTYSLIFIKYLIFKGPGGRVTDYRIPDFGVMMKANRLVCILLLIGCRYFIKLYICFSFF